MASVSYVVFQSVSDRQIEERKDPGFHNSCSICLEQLLTFSEVIAQPSLEGSRVTILEHPFENGYHQFHEKCLKAVLQTHRRVFTQNFSCPLCRQEALMDLESAATAGNLEAVTKYLDHGVTKQQFSQAFKNAVSSGHHRVTEKLLQTVRVEEDLDANKMVWVPAQKGDLVMVQILLNHGLVSVYDRGAALMIAAEKGYLNVIDALFASGEVSQEALDLALSQAAEEGHLKAVERILQEPVCETGRSAAFEFAAEAGHAQIVRVLLNSGPIEQDSKDWARNRALDKGFNEIVTIIDSLTITRKIINK